MALNWQSIPGVRRVRQTARYWLDEGGLAVADRVELARLEWQKQWSASIALVIATAVLLLFLFGTLIVGSVMVLLSYWQTPQWSAAWATLLAAWVLVVLIAALVAWRSVRRMAKPFALTRQVLAQDFEELKERL